MSASTGLGGAATFLYRYRRHDREDRVPELVTTDAPERVVDGYVEGSDPATVEDPFDRAHVPLVRDQLFVRASPTGDVFVSRRLRTVLAVDSLLTVLFGLLVYTRPRLLSAATDRTERAPTLGVDLARLLGAGAAVFGANKGLVYAALVHRYGDR